MQQASKAIAQSYIP